MFSRRDFIKIASAATIGLPLWGRPQMGPMPPNTDTTEFAIIAPPFMDTILRDSDRNYLNTTIPQVFAEYSDLFPILTRLPQFVVINTLSDAVIAHGDTLLAPTVLGDEALTLSEAQYLMVTLRFGSISTPHRGDDTTNFGKVIYLKQHPRYGYRTPPHLILEELIHIQQDITVMQAIIAQDQLDPQSCLHAQLKGISELGAHYYIDPIKGEPDYIFVMDDGQHADSAPDALARIGARVDAPADDVLQAITYDVDRYLALDAVAFDRENKHLWEMVTTWRHVRDASGAAVDIAPAYHSVSFFDSSASSLD